MSKIVKVTLILILLVAAFLRFYHYDLPDVINDEVFYGYRSIGLIDSLNSPLQPTPFESFDKIPLSARFSFHDHPPLAFWLQHLSFKIFGVNLLGLRMLFILAGTLSVYLTYLIARQLFAKEGIALLAAGILAVNNYHVFISRIGLQEGLVILFMLLAIWLFLRQRFYFAAAATGFAILTKYTAVVLIPIFLAYLLWKRRDFLSLRRIFLSIAILLVILSPVIIYNIGLYAARGHFDFQISYFLRQNVPQWEVRPGREVGGFAERIIKLFTQFGKGYGPVFSAVTAAAFVFALRKRREDPFQFLFLSFGFLILLFLAIGPQERFVAMLAPFLAIMVAVAFYNSPLPLFSRYALFLFLLLELAYTVNTYHLVSPKGRAAWHYSILRFDHNTWGYNQLEKYLQSEMKGFYPAGTLPLRFPFAQRLQDKALQEAKAEGKKPRAILFVTDSRLAGLASLWYLTRHTVYEAWPVISDQAYLAATAQDLQFFKNSGLKEVVFIKAGDTLLRPDEGAEAADQVEKVFKVFSEGGATTLEITDLAGKTAFRVYKSF